MKPLPFWKVQSVGNDFVLVHASDIPSDLPLDLLAEQVCHRRFGIGSDGLLVVEGNTLRMFNPDGTEDFCGNGLRCATDHAFAQGWIGRKATMQHGGQEIEVSVLETGEICTVLPPASFDPDRVPHRGDGEIFNFALPLEDDFDIMVSSLTTGSTHTVVPIDEWPEDGFFDDVSAAIEDHFLFPDRTSVIWLMPTGDRQLSVRIYERGVGETLGCGSGAAAAVVFWVRQTGEAGNYEVVSPGGSLHVLLDAWDGPISLTGRTETVFTGELDPDCLVQPED